MAIKSLTVLFVDQFLVNETVIMKSHKFVCQECEKTFSCEFEIREHKNIHTGECPFMCRFCDEVFTNTSDYAHHTMESHFTTENITTPSLILTKCGELRNLTDTNPRANRTTYRSKEVSGSLKARVRTSFTVENESIVEKQPHYVVKTRKNIGRLDKVHLSKSKKTKTYCCGQCNVIFTSVKKYSEHKKSHVFVCENCNNRYSSSEKLTKHVCFVSSDGEPFQCSCSLSFTKAAQFKLHVGNKPYSCCKCCMQFNRITNLVRHIRSHTKQKPYICKQCGRGFSQSTNLRNHASVHLGVKAIQCDECDFSCKTLGGLIKHKKKHKDGCVNHLSYVDRRKTSTETISCPICNKEFPFKRNVGMHMKIHKRKESLCQECGKVFDGKSKLTTHYKACHGVPSICQTCGKTFASSILLAAHEKIHVAGKNFSCTKCYKMFSIKNYLVQHMKTHSEGKHYSCSKCGKLFKVAVSLKYHSKICTSLNVL